MLARHLGSMNQWHCFTYQLELEFTMIVFAAEQCLTLLCPLPAQTTFWHEVPAPCLLVTVYRDLPCPFLPKGHSHKEAQGFLGPTLILQSTMAPLLVLNSVGFVFGDGNSNETLHSEGKSNIPCVSFQGPSHLALKSKGM